MIGRFKIIQASVYVIKLRHVVHQNQSYASLEILCNENWRH